MFFTTEYVNLLKKKKKISKKEEIFFNNDKTLRKANIRFKYNDDEIKKILKSKHDIFYFIEKILNIKLYEYQKNIIKHYKKYNIILYANSKDINYLETIALILIHDLLFFNSYNLRFVDKYNSVIQDLMKLIKKNYIKIPFYMQIGIQKWNTKKILLENNSSLSFNLISKISCFFESIDVIFFNNYAYYESENFDYIFSTIPVITARKNSKLIISSNLIEKTHFAKLFINSIQKVNIYQTLITKWTEHYGINKEWKDNKIKYLGNNLDAKILFENLYNVRIVSEREKKLYRILDYN